MAPQDTLPGGWCQREYDSLTNEIGRITTTPASCDEMRSTLQSWLSSGKMRRADLGPDDELAWAVKFYDQEWNDGNRLAYISLNPNQHLAPYDWASTLRHEYGHAYENHPTDPNSSPFSQARADEYQGYCRPGQSGSPPATAAGVAVSITSLPSEVTVGDTIYPTSNCSGTATWSGSGAVAVTGYGAVTGVEAGLGLVRVDCGGTFQVKYTYVLQSEVLECTLAQRLVSGVVGTPPALDYEEDCGGEPAPSPPAGGLGEDGEMDCYVITAHLYYWDWQYLEWVEEETWAVAYVCYLYGYMT